MYSNLWVSLGAAVLTAGTFRAIGAAVDGGLVGLVFSATLLVYVLDRLLGGEGEDREAGSERHRWVEGHRAWLKVLVGVGALGVGGSAFYLRLESLVCLGAMAALSFAYILPQGLRWRGLGVIGRVKRWPALNAFWVAVVWTVVTGLLPMVESGVVGWESGAQVTRWVGGFGWVLAWRFLFVFGLTLPFLVRDRRSDRESGIKTLAVILGPGPVIGLAFGVMGVGMVGSLMTGGGGVAIAFGLSFLALLPLWRVRVEVLSELYFSGLLDGMIVVKGVLLWVMG